MYFLHAVNCDSIQLLNVFGQIATFWEMMMMMMIMIMIIIIIIKLVSLLASTPDWSLHSSYTSRPKG